MATGFLLVSTALSLYIKKLQKDYSKQCQDNLITITGEATKSRIALEHNTKLFEKLYERL